MMICDLKVLGLLTAAVLATSAVVASTAQAAVKWTAGQTPSTHTTTKVHGTQTGPITENLFETEAAGGVATRISCTVSKFYGEVAGGETNQLTLEPRYEECGVTDNTTHVVANHRVTITTEGCTYKFTEPAHLEQDTFTGKVDLVCPAGKHPIEHLFGNAAHTTKVCTTETHSEAEGQGELSHVVYHNEDNGAATDDITMTVTVIGIKYFTNGVGCPEPNTTKTNGRFTTTITLTSGETSGSTTVSLNDDLWFSTT